jgi:GAF domain-containing protein
MEGRGAEAGGSRIARLAAAIAKVAAAEEPIGLIEDILDDAVAIAGGEAAEIVLVESAIETKPLLRVAVDARPVRRPLPAAIFGAAKVSDPNAPPLPRARPVAARVLELKRTVPGEEIPSGRAGTPDPVPDPPARLGVPILGGGRLFGYCYVERPEERGAFAAEERAGLEALCHALGAYLRGAFPP